MNSRLSKIQQNLEENIKKGDMLPAVIASNTHIQPFVRSNQVYKHCWTRVIGKHLITKMEPINPVDKHGCVCEQRRLNRRTLATWQKRKAFHDNSLFFTSWSICNVRSCYCWESSESWWGRCYASSLYIKHHWKENNGWNTETGDFEH